MTEQWKQLYDYKNYQISNLGNIKTLARPVYRDKIFMYYTKEKIVSSRSSKVNPHMFSSIFVPNDEGRCRMKTIYLHRAVADHFIKKPYNIIEYENKGGTIYATHIIKDYANNRYDNIKWIMGSELTAHQPNRLADPTKSWRTRRELYGRSGTPKKLI